jgi:hypothetical protein
MIRSLLAVSIVAMVSGVGRASFADTITFDGLSFGGSYDGYVEKGYAFTSDFLGGGAPDALSSWGDGGVHSADPSSSSATLFNNYKSTTTTLMQVGGGAFNLTSIDFADVFDTGKAAPFDMTFNFVGGTSVTHSYVLDSNVGLQTIAFGAHNLTSVSWIPTSDLPDLPWTQWDNVAIAAVTPLPDALPLFVSALAGLALVASRRKRSAPGR